MKINIEFDYVVAGIVTVLSIVVVCALFMVLRGCEYNHQENMRAPLPTTQLERTNK